MNQSENLQINSSIVDLISSKQAWHYRIIPQSQTSNEIRFYVEEKTEIGKRKDELEITFDKLVYFEPIETVKFQGLLEKYYKKGLQDTRLQNSYYHGESDNFLNHLITEAKNLNSSDIHVEIYDGKCRVRIRIDGMLVQRYLLDKKQYPSLINKIKIIANLDIAEKRLPQDGRIFFETNQGKLDIRVSVLPTLHGEKVVLRLLNNDATHIDITNLGFSKTDLDNYLEGIKKPNGILLISGPTGSGKTTTLYATLKILNKDSRNIITIEDPIEYTLEGINQVQLRENIGLNFAAALRTFLRQDPDIIMLGEIRDPETANMAIRAALTGHLVLSTIHTNSAWGTISRLIDMGIAPFLLSSTLNTSVAQRLVRLLCPICKMENPFDNSSYPKGFKPYKKVITHYTATGCTHCFNTGYKGRKAVYEVIPMDEELGELIKTGNHNIADILRSKGIGTLSENAFSLFERGLTSLEEIYSILVN
jgi:type IV pilus assembly protein PilB